MTIIGVAGIVLAAIASLLVQSASATTDVMTETVVEEEGLDTSSMSTNNSNNSNAVLGSAFLTGEDRLTSFNRINKTYTEVSYVGNRTIMPPNATTTATTINAIETGNPALKLQPNGITFVEGESLLVTEGGGGNNSGGAEQQENATAMFVDLNGVRPEDPRSSTGVVFFSTNSAGQLAFLDKMIAIYQVKSSPRELLLKCGNGKGQTFRLRLVVMVVPLLWRTTLYPHKYARGRIKESQWQ